MRVFLDVNVLIAVLNKEFPRFDEAARVLSLAGRRPFRIFTSTVSLAITWYFVEKKSGRQKATEKFKLLLEHLEICPCGLEEIHNIKQFKGDIDFEDGLQVCSAISSECDVIVSFDGRDYYFSPLPCFTPKEFLINLNKKAAHN